LFNAYAIGAPFWKTTRMSGALDRSWMRGLRSLYERPYVLLYRLHGDTAEVVAVVHAMRDLPAAIAARLHLEGE